MTTTPPAEIAVRTAEIEDLPAVARIERASFPQPWPRRAFERFLGESGFLVATGEPEGGEVARNLPAELLAGGADDTEGVRGFVVADVVTDYGRRIGHVKDLAIAPEWRGRGIGSRLLERALQVVADGGARRAKLEVRTGNEAARELYSSFGFTPNRVVPGYYDDGEDALLLVANLGHLAGDSRDGRSSDDRSV